MAAVVYVTIAIILIVVGAALTTNFARSAERVVSALTRRGKGSPDRVLPWRVLGMMYVLIAVLRHRVSESLTRHLVCAEQGRSNVHFVAARYLAFCE